MGREDKREQMLDLLHICLPHMHEQGALTTGQAYALRFVCKGMRDAVDELRLPVAVLFYPHLEKIRPGEVGRFDNAMLRNVLLCRLGMTQMRSWSAVRKLRLFSELLASLQTRLQVTHLSLYSTLQYGGEDSAMLAALLQQCAGITHLDIPGNSMQSMYCPPLTHVKGVIDVSALTYVNLDCNKVGDEGAEGVAALLARSTRLTHLLLSQNGVTQLGAKVLAKALRGCWRLEHVDLSGNELRNTGTVAVLGALGRCKAMQHVDLRENKIGVSGAKAVAGAVVQWAGLRTLRLGRNQVCNAGAEAVAAGLLQCKQLESLDVSCNRITGECVMSFSKIIRCCSVFQYLQLHGNSVDEDSMRAFFAEVCKVMLVPVSGVKRPTLRLSQ